MVIVGIMRNLNRRQVAIASVLAMHICSCVGQTRGSFSVMSYNVAGLPGPLSGSDPENNTPLISPRINAYDIVHVQEDFAYHHLLLKENTHEFKTKTSGNVPVGSGLNTLSKYPFTDLKRVKWEACWFGSGDCLTPKGFTSMRVTIAPGVHIDLYNLHAEAGDTDPDFIARNIGYQQLRRYIDKESAGQAVILFGDTNTRYTQTKDPIRLLTEGETGLTDVWTKLIRGGNPPAQGIPSMECKFPNPNPGRPVNTSCELIDKILYRSSPLVRLDPRAFLNEDAKFLTPSGGPLSDHYPIAAPFVWEINPVLRASIDYIGVTGEVSNNVERFSDLSSSGTTFDATSTTWGGVFVTEIALRNGPLFDTMTYRLNNGQEVVRGKTSYGNSSRLKLDIANKETLINIEACEGYSLLGLGELAVVYFRAETSLGRILEGGRKPGAGSLGRCSVWPAPGTEWTVVGFQGRAGGGGGIRSLGVLWGRIF